MKSKIKKNILKNYLKNNREKGQSSIEFILVLPFVIVIFLVFFQLGYCAYLQNNIEQSAREAARIISTTNSNAEAFNMIKLNLTKKNLVLDNISFYPGSESARRIGDYIKVRISISYGGFAHILENLIGQKIILKAESVMRMECGNQTES
ncbi:MAG: pilus assembly protein [Actinomycetota bacterium]|nr:pilus assembly protein [Actinomycetota bacterium]